MLQFLLIISCMLFAVANSWTNYYENGKVVRYVEHFVCQQRFSMDAVCKDTNPGRVNVCKIPLISKNLGLDEINYQEEGYNQSNS